jgi:hypothetical protein
MSYRHQNGRVLSRVSAEDKLNNQVILTGTDPELSVPKGIFFLETLILSTSTATIADGDGTTIIAGIASLDQQISPLRCDHGIIITGAVLYAKGFVIEGCLSE